MFYRCETPLAAYEKFTFVPGKGYPLLSFDPFQNFEEIKQFAPWPKCQLLRAPIIRDDFFADLIIYKGLEYNEIPDIMTTNIPIVSAKVLEIIRDMDEFEHQIARATFRDKQGNIIDRGEYYHLHIRRKLAIEDCGATPEGTYKDEYFVGTIQSIPELREKVEKLPVWQPPLDRHYCFFNEQLVLRFKQENLKFSEYNMFANPEGNLLPL